MIFVVIVVNVVVVALLVVTGHTTGYPNKGGISECRSVCFTVYVEFRIIIPNLFENSDSYVNAKYREISNLRSITCKL